MRGGCMERAGGVGAWRGVACPRPESSLSVLTVTVWQFQGGNAVELIVVDMQASIFLDATWHYPPPHGTIYNSTRHHPT